MWKLQYWEPVSKQWKNSARKQLKTRKLARLEVPGMTRIAEILIG